MGTNTTKTAYGFYIWCSAAMHVSIYMSDHPPSMPLGFLPSTGDEKPILIGGSAADCRRFWFGGGGYTGGRRGHGVVEGEPVAGAA